MDGKLLLANERKHGTTGERPIDRLLGGEMAALKELPKLAWAREDYHEGLVRKDSHVRFRGKYYSVDPALIGQTVRVIANAQHVWIYHDDRLAETHERVSDPLRSKSTKACHLAPWVRAMNDTSIYRSRAQGIGPHVDAVVTRMIGAGMGVIDFRRVWGLLSLEKSHPGALIDDACRRALDIGDVRLRTIRRLIDLAPKGRTMAPPEAAWPMEPKSGVDDRLNRFVRDLKEYAAVVAATAH